MKKLIGLALWLLTTVAAANGIEIEFLPESSDKEAAMVVRGDVDMPFDGSDQAFTASSPGARVTYLTALAVAKKTGFVEATIRDLRSDQDTAPVFRFEAYQLDGGHTALRAVTSPQTSLTWYCPRS